MESTWPDRTPPARTRPRKLVLWAGAVVFAGLFALTATVSPEQPGHYPVCPFRALTGYSCPGCGSLRALHDLAYGHFRMAMTHNAMLVVMLPVAITAWWRTVTGRTGTRASPRWLGPVALAVLLIWTVVRNLPALRGVLSAR